MCRENTDHPEDPTALCQKRIQLQLGWWANSNMTFQPEKELELVKAKGKKIIM
jgi:hypothetical protein